MAKSPSPRAIKVAEIISDSELVLNAGSSTDVKIGMKFLVYRVGKEIKDPDTGESLGRLETIVGEGVISHAQEKISTLRSTKFVNAPKRIIRKNKNPYAISSILNNDEEEEIIDQLPIFLPFNDPKIGDVVKRIG